MTDPADFTTDDELLPGLSEPSRGEGEVEAAARRTLAALEPTLDARHSLIAQTLLTIARQLDRATATGRSKDYGVANLVNELRATYVVLMPETDEGGNGDAFDQLARELRCASGLCDHPKPCGVH
jgi:hypothetical protein